MLIRSDSQKTLTPLVDGRDFREGAIFFFSPLFPAVVVGRLVMTPPFWQRCDPHPFPVRSCGDLIFLLTSAPGLVPSFFPYFLGCFRASLPFGSAKA